MLKFFGNCFEAICCILSVLNFLILGTVGGFGGYFLATSVLYEDPELYVILLALAGIAIAFFNNVFTFGLVSIIIQIKNNTYECYKCLYNIWDVMPEENDSANS